MIEVESSLNGQPIVIVTQASITKRGIDGESAFAEAVAGGWTKSRPEFQNALGGIDTVVEEVKEIRDQSLNGRFTYIFRAGISSGDEINEGDMAYNGNGDLWISPFSSTIDMTNVFSLIQSNNNQVKALLLVTSASNTTKVKFVKITAILKDGENPFSPFIIYSGGEAGENFTDGETVFLQFALAGEKGKSAYQTALDGGYLKSEATFNSTISKLPEIFTVGTYEEAEELFVGNIIRTIYVLSDAAYFDGDKSFYTYHPDLGAALMGLDYDYKN